MTLSYNESMLEKSQCRSNASCVTTSAGSKGKPRKRRVSRVWEHEANVTTSRNVFFQNIYSYNSGQSRDPWLWFIVIIFEVCHSSSFIMFESRVCLIASTNHWVVDFHTALLSSPENVVAPWFTRSRLIRKSVGHWLLRCSYLQQYLQRTLSLSESDSVESSTMNPFIYWWNGDSI